MNRIEIEKCRETFPNKLKTTRNKRRVKCASGVTIESWYHPSTSTATLWCEWKCKNCMSTVLATSGDASNGAAHCDFNANLPPPSSLSHPGKKSSAARENDWSGAGSNPKMHVLNEYHPRNVYLTPGSNGNIPLPLYFTIVFLKTNGTTWMTWSFTSGALKVCNKTTDKATMMKAPACCSQRSLNNLAVAGAVSMNGS